MRCEGVVFETIAEGDGTSASAPALVVSPAGDLHVAFEGPTARVSAISGAGRDDREWTEPVQVSGDEGGPSGARMVALDGTNRDVYYARTTFRRGHPSRHRRPRDQIEEGVPVGPPVEVSPPTWEGCYRNYLGSPPALFTCPASAKETTPTRSSITPSGRVVSGPRLVR